MSGVFTRGRFGHRCTQGSWCEQTRWKTGQRQTGAIAQHARTPRTVKNTWKREERILLWKRAGPANTLLAAFQPLELGDSELLLSSPPLVGMLVQQPWETNHTNHIKSTFPKEHCESTALLWSQQSLGSNTMQIKSWVTTAFFEFASLFVKKR